MKAAMKRWWFGLLGKDPEGVILCYASGEPARAARMASLMRELVPDRRHYLIERVEDLERVRDKRVALQAVLFDGGDDRGLRAAAFRRAPGKVLAFNAALERHHLRLSCPIASWLFWRGVPLDRIWLRPAWLFPRRRERSVLPKEWRPVPARGAREGKPRVAIVSPYLPWPLAHGGAVRLWNLLRAVEDEYDVWFFGFEDGQTAEELREAGRHCAFLGVAGKPRYREPRWSTLAPPEVGEFFNPALAEGLRAEMGRAGVKILQAEYTQMAAYGPDVLVEHDVTFDLYAQVAEARPSAGASWDRWRWERFERRALGRARRVVVMSEKDRGLCGRADAAVVPNGVDLERFACTPDAGGARLLFVGSFRHFPNVMAWRWMVERVWPLLPEGVEMTVVAGPEPERYDATPAPAGVTRLGFVEDVAPLYRAATMVVIPTQVSAGTNLKALEAMAAGRAMVSTPSGVAGLGLEPGVSVEVEESAEGFAGAVRRLLEDGGRREQMARAARRLAEERYGWAAVGEAQKRVWRGFE